MEITSRGNSLKQQLAGALCFPEVPLPETKVNSEQIPPVTPRKNESQVANYRNEVQETNSVQRKQKRKKYKPKVVDDGASSKKLRKSPDLKDTNAKAPTTPVLKPQCPRVPITPEPKLANHESPVTCESKSAIPQAPLSIDPIPQLKMVQITHVLKHSNTEVCITPELTCMDLEAAVPPNPTSENIRFPNASESKNEKLKGPITPDVKSDLKPLTLAGLTQAFARKRRSLHICKDKITTGAEPSLVKSSMGMQLNYEVGAEPEKSVRRQLKFGVVDCTELVSSEETITTTNPNLNKSVMAINLDSDDVIEQLQPLKRGPESGPESEKEQVKFEEKISVTTHTKNIRFPNAGESKNEKLKGPITPDLKSDLKPLTLAGLTQAFVRKGRSLHICKDKNTTGAEPSLVKSSMGMQLNNEVGAEPEKSVRRQLNFGVVDCTELVSSEETITTTNPNLNKSVMAINLDSGDVIEQLQPLKKGPEYGPESEKEQVRFEEKTSVTTQNPESAIGTATNLNCHDAVKPVQLVANGMNIDLGDMEDAVMHGEMHAGTDSSLNQAETGKVMCLDEDVDRIGIKDYLIHLAAQCLRGVKRGRAKQSPKSNVDDMLEESVLNLYDNAIIPYQEKKYRGIVALDEDSLIEWNILMGEDKCGSNSAPGLNSEREEKWRKERDNFRNHAELFIAKMKLIQGDRCFSQWKGSVVDSVVGAFLTQNVSDQLSSSAFISLCARYPQWRDVDVTSTGKQFPDFEVTKTHMTNEPYCAVDLVNPHIEGRPQNTPEGNMPQELTKEGRGSPKSEKADVPKKKGYKIGMEDIEWDALRKVASRQGYTREGKSVKTKHAADWDAVRQADTSEVAKAIHGRGQANILAERIQDFLNRVVKDHGSMDLEWLRETPGDQAKEYLLSIYGLGLKSVECIRLLALHQVAFPVDTNVGRIAVRLGWVPLRPLPESVQIHLLESYPVMDTIQKYLWPRLCELDQETLYELHYQMITFGKVFCTKSKPNCNACPLRSDCKHFASAFASARLMLPEPQQHQENKILLWNGAGTTSDDVRNSVFIPADARAAQFGVLSSSSNCEPIIEEPMTPEEEQIVEEIPDMEDFCFDDPDEIPTINLNMESFVKNMEEIAKKNDSDLQIEDISKALVLLPPIAASIPPPQLKHSRHLRTVHDAYELPDGHPILRRFEFEERDPADPFPYLLILYSPEKEVADCKPCLCNSCKQAQTCNFLSQEEESTYVKCSIMIPCRTAMRGSFPLNGTYFQVNEVFADHCSARNPVMVARDEIWWLRRCSVYFGSTVSSILKGLPTEEIQFCFWRGFVCVREFDRMTRYPKSLSSWLHLVPTMKKKVKLAQ